MIVCRLFRRFFRRESGFTKMIMNGKHNYYETNYRLFLLPIVLIMLTSILIPIVNTVRYSFLDLDFISKGAGSFSGFRNYGKALSDPVLWKSLFITIRWTVYSIVFQFGLGFALALLLKSKQVLINKTVLRSLFLVPWMLPGALAAIMWKWLYHGSVGLINQMLLRMHIISAPIPWLASTQFVLISVVLVNVWRGAPFFMVMLFGGLQTIPNELYEAAMIDGAGSFTSFRKITVPLLKPLILTLSLYGFIGAFNFIDIILVLTKGGPAHHTLTLPLYVWQLAFVDMKISYATAVCVLMCLFLVVLLGIMMVFLKKRGEDDE